MKDERAHLQLFDLIARDWHLASPAQQITFNADDSAVAFACADGSVHLAATADKASPNQRTRRAIDTGRLTIAPRDKPFLPLRQADFTAGRSASVVACGPTGFAFAKADGRINSLTPGGIAVHIAARASSAITSLVAMPDGKTVAFAAGGQLHISAATSNSGRAYDLPAPPTVLAISPDGGTLAAAFPGGLACWSLANLDIAPSQIALPGAALGLTWHPSGAWLGAALGTDGFALIQMPDQQVQHRGNFPAPVLQTAFGASTDAVVASGAFRLAAWSLQQGESLVTGKAGLVLIAAVAASPNRNLVAAGYANGLLSLAEIGRPTEMLLREDTGAGVSALSWSANGSYLAVAGSDGSAALVEFPDSMFKPSSTS